MGATVHRLTLVQVTPSLSIGGVETYLCRLTEALTARGHRMILVMERPGTYADRAQAAGAEILTFPFTSEGRDRAAEELGPGVDIVHAHNYRAARFAAPLAAALGARYLMTVHGPRRWLKRALFRAWSDPVIAMSEADRENISGLFGVPRDRVRLSFYGIDTERFRPGIDPGPIRAEWGVPEDARLVLNVSRFSHRKARPALAALAALPELRDALGDVRLVLVGDGPELDRIRSAAERVNEAEADRDSAGDARTARNVRSAGDVRTRGLGGADDGAGGPVALAVGPRTDIAQVMNAADVVIATANTALEAIACGVPTIAFGRTGYFGPVTRESFEAARAVCFADHGDLPRGGPARLAADLRALLSDPEAARDAARRVREHVVSEYGIERMADDIERIYAGVLGADRAEAASKDTAPKGPVSKDGLGSDA